MSRIIFKFLFFILMLTSHGVSATPSLQEAVHRVFIANEAPQDIDLEEMRDAELKLTALEEHNSDKAGLHSLARDMALKYLLAGYVQESIWTFSRAGLDSEADLVESQVLQSLSSGSTLQGQSVQDHRTAEWWKYASGIQALAKSDHLDGQAPARYEAFAYKLDRLLGINRVPVTVVIEKKKRTYSLQLRLKASRITNIHFKGNGYQYEISGADEIYVMDYLAGQTDRHNLNSLYSATGRLALIDNGRSFGYLTVQKELTPLPEEYLGMKKTINSRLMRRIESVRLMDLQLYFRELLTEQEIQKLFERFQELQKYFGNDCRPLLPQAAFF